MKLATRPIFAAVLGVLLFGAIGIASAGNAEAKRPAPKAATAYSLTLNQANPYLGESVSFSYTSSLTSPRIRVICYQSSAMVFAADQDASTTFLLGGAGSTWTANGGSADCQADLYDNTSGSNFTLYASLTFTALGAP